MGEEGKGKVGEEGEGKVGEEREAKVGEEREAKVGEEGEGKVGEEREAKVGEEGEGKVGEEGKRERWETSSGIQCSLTVYRVIQLFTITMDRVFIFSIVYTKQLTNSKYSHKN